MKVRIILSFLIVALSLVNVRAQTHSSDVGILSQDFRRIGAPLPPIKMQDRAGIEYTVTDITEGRYFFMVLFNPTCGHCVDLASLLMQHRQEFEDNTVMFIAGAEMAQYFGPFISESNWSDDAERIIGTAGDDFINSVYNFGTLPQVNIYDADQKLVKVLSGEISIEDLRPYIR